MSGSKKANNFCFLVLKSNKQFSVEAIAKYGLNENGLLGPKGEFNYFQNTQRKLHLHTEPLKLAVKNHKFKRDEISEIVPVFLTETESFIYFRDEKFYFFNKKLRGPADDLLKAAKKEANLRVSHAKRLETIKSNQSSVLNMKLKKLFENAITKFNKIKQDYSNKNEDLPKSIVLQ